MYSTLIKKNFLLKKNMPAQNQSMALGPWQSLNGQRVLRIPRLDRRTHDRGVGEMLKVCTVNVGTMKGRSQEVVLKLARRKTDICCV